MSGASRTTGSAWARITGTGQLPRAMVWLVVILNTVGLVGQLPRGPGQVAIFVSLSASFLVWDLTRERFGRWGPIVGVVIFALGNVFQWHFTMCLGLAQVALTIPLRWRLPIVTSAIAVLAVIWWQAYPPDTVLQSALGLVPNILVIYLFDRIRTKGIELADVQEQLALTEVDNERTRLAEQVNQTLGGILMQADVQTSRIRSATADVDHPEFQRQVGELSDLLDRSQVTLKRLAHEPMVSSLADEIRAATTLCRRLGVDFTSSGEDVPGPAAELFALMLREAVTNMLKHALATRCTLVVRADGEEALFGFTNDGVQEMAESGRDGSGQRRWRRAVTELGGVLETGRLGGDRYQVSARVPVRVGELADDTAS